MDWEELQHGFDVQQESYLPDREQRFAAMLDAVEAVVGTAPRVLDLAGGTGSITRRVLARFPGASSVVADVDAALLSIAAGSVAGDDRVEIVTVDLAGPEWVDALAQQHPFDAVLTATALHWLPAERVEAVYAEAGQLLTPGGVLLNCDHMPDDGLGLAGQRLGEFAEQRNAERRQQTHVPDWDQWWDELRTVPGLRDAVAARDERFADHVARGGHTQLDAGVEWHLDALRRAGFTSVGLAWRGLADAAVLGVRPATPSTIRTT